MSLTKEQVLDLRKALNEVLEKHGVEGWKLQLGSGRFAEAEVTFTLLATPEEGEPQRHVDYRRYAEYEQLKPEWLGQQFTMGGRKYTIDGYLRGRSKNTVAIVRDDGKAFVTSASQIRRGMMGVTA